MKKHLIAIATAALLGSGLAAAQGPTTPAAAPTAAESANMHNRHDAAAKGEKEALEHALAAGQQRGDYARILERNGYRVSAINADKPDYLEYEVVKGDHSYEVQLDFDSKAAPAKASKIDVTNNLWRANSTEQMLKDANYRSPTPLAADPEGRYSDRRYMKNWTSEREQLQKALPANQKLSAYKPKLEQLGYKITSVNDREKDYIEYEVVRGDNSYEVQIDVDPATQLSKKVDVDANLWDADATARAKAANHAAKP